MILNLKMHCHSVEASCYAFQSRQMGFNSSAGLNCRNRWHSFSYTLLFTPQSSSCLYSMQKIVMSITKDKLYFCLPHTPSASQGRAVLYNPDVLVWHKHLESRVCQIGCQNLKQCHYPRTMRILHCFKINQSI